LSTKKLGGVDASRFGQILYSAVKVPLLLLATFALSLLHASPCVGFTMQSQMLWIVKS